MMSSTPDFTSKTKSSPIGSSISKSLLTPCRRVGLSRKRKTPSSVIKNISEQLDLSHVTNTSFTTEHTPLSNLTPVNPTKSLSKTKRKSNFIVETNSPPPCLEVTKENEDSEDDDIPLLKMCRSKKILVQTFPSETEKNTVLNEIKFDNLKENNYGGIKKVSEKTDKESVKRTVNLYLKESGNTYSSPKSDESDEEFLIKKKTKKNKQKSSKKDQKVGKLKKTTIISNKPSESNSDDEFDFKTHCKKQKTLSKKTTSESFEDCNVKLERLSDEFVEKSIILNNSKDTTVVDSEDDDFVSTPDKERQDKEFKRKIKELEVEVGLKQKKLTALQQASVYKNKHDTKALSELTATWLNGCVSGLNDLLKQLQAHGPMTMQLLVNKFRIPEDLLAKLPISLDE